MNMTVEQYNGWMDTEERIVALGCTNEEDLLFIESVYHGVLDLIDYNMSLLKGDDIDSDTAVGASAVRVVDLIAASIDREEEFAARGRVMETRFYDACKKLFGCTSVVKASLQDDILAGTDYFVYGFRVDITLRDKSEHAIAKDIYYCENNGLQCTASILNRNKHGMYPAPVLSLRLSGNVDSFQPLYHLIKLNIQQMLLEFNRMCHVLECSL